MVWQPVAPRYEPRYEPHCPKKDLAEFQALDGNFEHLAVDTRTPSPGRSTSTSCSYTAAGVRAAARLLEAVRVDDDSGPVLGVHTRGGSTAVAVLKDRCVDLDIRTPSSGRSTRTSGSLAAAGFGAAPRLLEEPRVSDPDGPPGGEWHRSVGGGVDFYSETHEAMAAAHAAARQVLVDQLVSLRAENSRLRGLLGPVDRDEEVSQLECGEPECGSPRGGDHPPGGVPGPGAGAATADAAGERRPRGLGEAEEGPSLRGAAAAFLARAAGPLASAASSCRKLGRTEKEVPPLYDPDSKDFERSFGEACSLLEHVAEVLEVCAREPRCLFLGTSMPLRALRACKDSALGANPRGTQARHSDEWTPSSRKQWWPEGGEWTPRSLKQWRPEVPPRALGSRAAEPAGARFDLGPFDNSFFNLR
uniref:Uncharacterized protein n=1 Tax=Pyrodinium bahamense TaxID=73915 RepID=A0A6T9BYQ0_9DINO|mmetsp:Transcript_53422/g.147997  ORF Transcript_53422/g.147997 Transcript_53422/m.147997 type:complete len:418 (+) Transcript_53422:85-1338(+)